SSDVPDLSANVNTEENRSEALELQPVVDSEMEPAVEPTMEPTTEPTMEPTMELEADILATEPTSTNNDNAA
ncbi:hypothetical protein GGH97_004713, partial [Coemansia sp. RSA 475]